MAKKKASYRKRRIVREKPPETCFYCDKNADPDYKDYETLGKFVSERARIIGKDRSGVCSKHQRKLSSAIKRARHLGLLPFAPSV
jgi:small subunit ribosomal protein S18